MTSLQSQGQPKRRKPAHSYPGSNRRQRAGKTDRVRPADDLARELRRDGTRPFLTWYDDADGSRVELSVATTANWVAKIANWLVDDADVEPGTPVALGAAGHWLTPLCALAAWSVGATLAPPGSTAVAHAPDGDPSVFQRSVLSQPDEILAPLPSNVTEPALDAPEGARVLSTLSLEGETGLALLLAVLRCGGSLVLVTNADAAKLADRATSERATHSTGVDLPGLARLA